jgi:hypothetical protein
MSKNITALYTEEWQVKIERGTRGRAWKNLSEQDETWAEFATLS